MRKTRTNEPWYLCFCEKWNGWLTILVSTRDRCFHEAFLCLLFFFFLSGKFSYWMKKIDCAFLCREYWLSCFADKILSKGYYWRYDNILGNEISVIWKYMIWDFVQYSFQFRISIENFLIIFSRWRNLNFVELVDKQRNIRMIIICIQLNLAIYEGKK